MAGRCSWQLTWGNWPIHTTMAPQQKDLDPSPVDSEILKAGMYLRATDMYVSRTKGHSLSMKQEKIIPYKLINSATGSLFLVKEVFQDERLCT